MFILHFIYSVSPFEPHPPRHSDCFITAVPSLVQVLSLPFHHWCRFHRYDCLVMPANSVAPCFPWEKVTLLVEYEQPITAPLFDGSLPKSLEQYIVLKTVLQGMHSAGMREPPGEGWWVGGGGGVKIKWTLPPCIPSGRCRGIG